MITFPRFYISQIPIWFWFPIRISEENLGFTTLELKNRLNKMGIEVRRRYSKPLYNQLKNILSKEFKLYSRFYSHRNVYVVEIYGYSNLKKWMSLIGFSNKRHLDKIASVA